MDRILFELSATAAVGADELQWIVYRRAGRGWNGVSFVRSTKAILERCIRQKGVDVTPEGRAKLDALPASFDLWKAARATAAGASDA